MDIPTISAGRFFKAEIEGRLSKANPILDLEDWPIHTMCRTYDLQTTITDSGGSATAYLGGTKTGTGIIGLTGAVRPKSCRRYEPEERVESVLEAAMEAGMATGIVTTSRVTHASPAGAFAHTASRNWESDRKALSDLQAFEEAIRVGTQMVNLKETLVIVTADHSHSMLLGGQPNRKRSLLELNTELDRHVLDGKGMLPLMYTSGPAGAVNTTRLNLSALSNATLHDTNFQQPTFIPLPWATHGGEDVGFYATGVFSYLFHSTADNTFIGQSIKFALCLRPDSCFFSSAEQRIKAPLLVSNAAALL
ncbi:intestinal type alkaline phosphatase [Echinococcus multilocularis]|uniref:Alkaline phosphatase n=1 Tax=Echinococcus multilocularis TaxID=6211 RepID=A0A068YCP8_ECHMU|nr:intestinal type alkaline phosphatase [Echinococcus multilocularis]